jgi:hypothetical protein
MRLCLALPLIFLAGLMSGAHLQALGIGSFGEDGPSWVNFWIHFMSAVVWGAMALEGTRSV